MGLVVQHLHKMSQFLVTTFLRPWKPGVKVVTRIFGVVCLSAISLGAKSTALGFSNALSKTLAMNAAG